MEEGFPLRRGFSADAGVEVEVAWGVRALVSESTRRMATDFMASALLGVDKRLRSGGPLTAGDLKACLMGVLLDLAESMPSGFKRLGGGSEARGTSVEGRFLLGAAAFGTLTAKGDSSSEPDVESLSLGSADGCNVVLR